MVNQSVQEEYADDWLFEEMENGVPLIVWTNKTRVGFISATRKAFGYTGLPKQGEPVVIRQNRGGMANNEVGITRDTDQQERIQVEFSPERRLWFRCWDEDSNLYRPKKTIAIRFGYAITAHTAQGGEWGKVLVDMDSYKAQKRRKPVEANRWLYTAATRAKKELVLVKDLNYWLRRT